MEIKTGVVIVPLTLIMIIAVTLTTGCFEGNDGTSTRIKITDFEIVRMRDEFEVTFKLNNSAEKDAYVTYIVTVDEQLRTTNSTLVAGGTSVERTERVLAEETATNCKVVITNIEWE